MSDSPSEPGANRPLKPKRRPRYAGKHPRRFGEKYKELDPARYADDVAKVLGKTALGGARVA